MQHLAEYFTHLQHKIALMFAVLVAIFTAASYGLTVKDIIDLGLPSWLWLIIGWCLFVVIVLAIVVQFIHDVDQRRRLIERQEQPTSMPIKEEEQPSFIYSANRSARDYPHMVKTAGHRVRVAWNSGGGLKREHRLEELFPHIREIILPYPDLEKNPALRDLAIGAESKRSDEPPERIEAAIEEVRSAIDDVTADIEAYNAEALSRGDPTIKTWWYKGHMGTLVTLSDDWVFVEIFVSGLRAHYRPGLQIFKTGEPDDPYPWLERAYNYMLDEAEDALTIRERQRAVRQPTPGREGSQPPEA